MWKYNDWITLTSETFDDGLLMEVLRTTKIHHENVHVQYPAIPEGAHLSRFFNIKQAIRDSGFIVNATHDMDLWTMNEDIDFDVIFAPNQPAVRKIVEAFVSSRAVLKTRAVFWEYLPTGQFGDKIVSGEIKPGDRVLVYNAVSIQGRCIGERLPSFAKALGGEVVAIACFAKGTTPKVRELEKRWGNKFYSAIQIDIPVYKAEDCPMCKAGEKLIPWTEL